MFIRVITVPVQEKAFYDLKLIKKDIKEATVRGILCAPRVPDMVKKLLSDYELEWKEVERQIILPDDYQKTLKDF